MATIEIATKITNDEVIEIKVLVIGDPHFKTDNIVECEEMTRKLVKLAQSILPTFIVVLGDVLHRHEKIHVIPLMKAEKMIRLLSEIAPTFVLIGNHDRPNNSTYLTDEHPFNALKLWPNTYIVDNSVKQITVNNKKFLFLPYVYPGLFINTLEHPEKGVKSNDNYHDTVAIFCHQEFYGAQMGIIKSQAGDKWPLSNPLAISGHIHDYDRPQENIIYVGTPYQDGYSDNISKTVSLFTFDNSGYKEDRIDLGLVKKVLIHLSVNEIHDYQPPTDKMIKIIIKGDDASLKSISKLEKIKEWKKMGIKIAYKAIISSEVEIKKGPTLKLTYKDRLYVTVCKDLSELAWFNKLFHV